MGHREQYDLFRTYLDSRSCGCVAHGGYGVSNLHAMIRGKQPNPQPCDPNIIDKQTRDLIGVWPDGRCSRMGCELVLFLLQAPTAPVTGWATNNHPRSY